MGHKGCVYGLLPSLMLQATAMSAHSGSEATSFTTLLHLGPPSRQLRRTSPTVTLPSPVLRSWHHTRYSHRFPPLTHTPLVARSNILRGGHRRTS